MVLSSVNSCLFMAQRTRKQRAGNAGAYHILSVSPFSLGFKSMSGAAHSQGRSSFCSKPLETPPQTRQEVFFLGSPKCKQAVNRDGSFV